MANIGVICTALDPISIVYNFIALAIIAEFDNYVYSSMKNESFKELIEKKFVKKVLVIKHTTSKKCKEDEYSGVRDQDGNMRPLRIMFKSRTLLNKVLFMIYKVLRAFYVSVFFYFLPFSSILISSILPIVARNWVGFIYDCCNSIPDIYNVTESSMGSVSSCIAFHQ